MPDDDRTIAMDELRESAEHDHLMPRWLTPFGIGYLPVAGYTYGQGYWDEYRARDQSPMGAMLTSARLRLVCEYAAPADAVDVGIGGGRYVEEAHCLGTDINPSALAWLDARHARWDGINHRSVFTFWDSLEHIDDPAGILSRCDEFAFISTPIYLDQHDARRSKHFKPGEHIWYFTDDGIVHYMAMFGFSLIADNRLESDLGRVGIGTYVFWRKK